MTVSDLTPLQLLGLFLAGNFITLLAFMIVRYWRDGPLWPTKIGGIVTLTALFGLMMMGLIAAKP